LNNSLIRYLWHWNSFHSRSRSVYRKKYTSCCLH